METPEVPAGVLLQSLIFDVQDRVGGYRIYHDGRYETRPLGQEWTFGSPLTPAQMEAVKAAIAAAGFERLAGRYQAAPSDEDHNTLWMQVVEDQTVRSVAIEGACQVPEINTLSAQLVEIFKK
ncbi:MAG: hypothetical protein BroJett011_16700 [Chloroflexota bacterium]|nr:MAG: hypothetical protein BroJett011_16700 [Chloroflexota bacterium]